MSAMIKTTIIGATDLQLSTKAQKFNRFGQIKLIYSEYRAFRAPSFYDYHQLIAACCKLAMPTINILNAHGYSEWLFLNGAPLNLEQKARFKNYSLSRRARESGLIGAKFLEQTVRYENNSERVCGIYNIGRERLCNTFEFLTMHAWSLVVLSARKHFLTKENLMSMYEASITDVRRDAQVAMNWEILAVTLCAEGDVIIKTWGTADDLYRSIVLIYSRNVPISNLLGLP